MNGSQPQTTAHCDDKSSGPVASGSGRPNLELYLRPAMVVVAVKTACRDGRHHHHHHTQQASWGRFEGIR